MCDEEREQLPSLKPVPSQLTARIFILAAKSQCDEIL